MTQFVIANNVNTQLATAATSTATSLTLASAGNLPTLSAGQIMPLTLNDAATGLIYEIVYVTAISGVTLTVERAQEGTGAQNWNIGDYAYCAPTAGTVAVSTGNPNNTFLVDTATASQHAVQLQQAQSGSLTYAIAGGTANALTVNLTPAIPAYTDGMVVHARITATNASGGVTLAVNGLSPVYVQGMDNEPITAGTLIENGYAAFQFDAAQPAWILRGCFGAPQQITPGVLPSHAATLGQISGVVGQSRNLTMSVTAASATATMTADEIIVESALGGLRYCLSSFSETINLATTGAGGMDTGSAPDSGFVALYAIYNPTTQTAALLATNAATKQGNVYGGSNMPAGYTASALVSVWPTNGSSQFAVAEQKDRSVGIPGVTVLSTTTSQASFTSLSITSAVPVNAVSVSLRSSVSSSASTYSGSMNFATNSAGVGAQTCSAASPLANAALVANMADIKITGNSQAVYYNSGISSGTPTYAAQVYEYKF